MPRFCEIQIDAPSRRSCSDITFVNLCCDNNCEAKWLERRAALRLLFKESAKRYDVRRSSEYGSIYTQTHVIFGMYTPTDGM